MVHAAGLISAEQLHGRLDARHIPQELRELAESFNAMLDRLEGSFRRLSAFSSDLAHELRTPLNSLMLQAQVSLDKPRTAEHLRGVLASGLEELERMSRMVNDMLFLAKADHAQIALDRQFFSLEDEVAKVFDYFEPLALERDIRLEREGAASVRADRGMVRRVLANLVSNAVRHADAGSRVRVRLTTEPAGVGVAVVNRGAQVCATDAERLFDRFYRADASRSADGAGLGLAIVKSIVELHGGKASVGSAEGETTFRVTFGHAAAAR
jgi:two-component system heavy metal sensor histidine kinase CusS